MDDKIEVLFPSFFFLDHTACVHLLRKILHEIHGQDMASDLCKLPCEPTDVCSKFSHILASDCWQQ